MLDRYRRPMPRNDVAAAQVRNELRVVIVVRQHAPGGRGVGVQRRDGVDGDGVAVAFGIDGDGRRWDGLRRHQKRQSERGRRSIHKAVNTGVRADIPRFRRRTPTRTQTPMRIEPPYNGKD